jgi:hypothetical protein
MMSLINGNTTVFQCIADAYVKNDIQRFYYGFNLCIRAKTDMNKLYTYINNKHKFSRKVCADMLKLARE